MTKPTSWSFSSLQTYETCPHRYQLKYVTKIKEPTPAADNPAVRGNRIHERLEAFILRPDIALPEEATSLASYYETLRTFNPTVEEEIGLSKDLSQVAWNHPNIWLKLKMDAFYIVEDTHAVIVDHKSGQDYPIKRLQQGQLYAWAMSCIYPALETFTTQFAYVDQGSLKQNNFKRKAITTIGQNFTKRANGMLEATSYPAKPNNSNCKYCSYGSAGNSACQFRFGE